MKKYLNSVEEVVKALKEGKEIFNIDDSSKYFMIGDTICKKYENNTIIFNASLNFRAVNEFYTEEPEPLEFFEVNRAYKTRDGSKVFLFKIKTFGAYEYYFIGDYGVKFCVDIEGKFKKNQESPFDIVGYWEEEK